MLTRFFSARPAAARFTAASSFGSSLNHGGIRETFLALLLRTFLETQTKTADVRS
jgi:hypothetical protein